MASIKVAPLWEGGYQTVHTGGKAVGGSLIVCVCVMVLAVVGVHLFP